MAAIGSSTMSLRRQIKNVVSNYSDAQVKVREATSNDPWGPSSSLMSEIADMTNNAMAFTEIMQMVWKRLNDHGKNWRHVYKSLVLLDYLIKVGSEKVAQQCRENIFAIQTLKDFQHVDDNKDQGMNVREKAKQLVALLKDEERLKNERTKALMAKKRFSQNGVGIGSDGTTSHVRRSDTYHGGGADESGMAIGGRTRRSSEFEECRPSSVGEEELQLQIALALSREEAQKEEDQRKSDDVRLQMALNESKTSDVSSTSIGAATASAGASQRNHTNAIDDLLSLQMPTNTIAAASSSSGYGASNDPWSSSPRHVAGAPAPSYDPWGAPTQNHNDPWNEPPAVSKTTPIVSATNDPWSAPNNFSQPPINDPWSSNMNDPFNTSKLPDFTGGSMNNDPFAVNSTPYNVNNHQQNRIDELDAFLSSNSNNGVDDDTKYRQMKTPETFLGENSSLVNLDNLMGPSKPLVSGLPAAAVKPNSASVPNPFAIGTAASTNPFLVQQRPSPTLNQMKASGAVVSPGGWSSATTTPRGASAANNAWNMPQPMEPRPASTNPFLS